MTSERWETVKRIFGEAIDTLPEQRSALLDRECGADVALRDEIEELLRQHDDSGVFLELPSDAGALHQRAWTGRVLGAYRLTEWIGAGGMGSVFAAERADDHFEKRVAVKLLKSGMESREIRERFRLERQVLARLEHPNIARLIDGGETDEGLPYLVMEYVEGLPIDRYCIDHGLTLDQRLDLLLGVCDAVQYAHRNLVVHRDLKPGNILVNESGEVKLLDFGIAKVLDGEDSAVGGSLTEMLTGPSSMRLTPRYASPEQVRGEVITTATDVYAVSVILYELLTGHHPYRVPGTDSVSIAQAICEVDPMRPSTAVLRRDGGGAVEEGTGLPDRDSIPDRERPQWRRRLRGDLDTIVLTGLRKDPERRYRTIAELAEDVRRYRAGLPIVAAPDSVGYRVGKFVRRNRALVALALFAGIAVVAGLASTTALWLRTSSLLADTELAEQREGEARRRAEDRLGVVRSMARMMLYDLNDVVENLPGSTPARELLARTAQHYLDQLADEAVDDPAFLLDLASSYLRLAEVQGTGPRGGLGDLSSALESLDRGLRLVRIVESARPDDASVWSIWCNMLHRRGETLRLMGRNEEALQAYERTREIAARAAEADPTAGTPHHFAFICRQAEARVAESVGDYEKALDLYDLASAALERSTQRIGESAETRRDAALPLIARGSVLAMRLGRVEEALEDFSRAEELLNAIEDDPNDVDLQATRQALADALARAAQEQGNLRKAIYHSDQSLEIARRLVALDPTNDRHRRELSIGLERSGDLFVEKRRLRQAADAYRESLAVVEGLAEIDETNLLPLDGVVTVGAKLAGALFELGEHDEALAAARRGMSAGRAFLSEDPTAMRPAINLAQCFRIEAFIHDRRRDHAAAAAAFEDYRDLSQAQVERRPDAAWTYRNLANACGGYAKQYEMSANACVAGEDLGSVVLVPSASGFAARDPAGGEDAGAQSYAYAIEQLEESVRWYRRATEVAFEMEARGYLEPHESGVPELFAKDLGRAESRLEEVRGQARISAGD